VLAGFFLELRHAVEPAEPRHAVEDPGELSMLGHAGLVENGRACRIDAGSDIGGRHFIGRVLHFGGLAVAGIVRDRVHIDHAVDAIHLVLHAHPVLERAQIVAEVQRIGRLHSGEYEWLVLRRLAHDSCFSKGARLCPGSRHRFKGLGFQSLQKPRVDRL
jgi:hypothetical protein